MDPATLSIVMRALAPVLGMLAFATLPTGAEAAPLVRGRER
jgi:hypothetical protein